MSDYCETPEFYSEEKVRARKPHQCCECLRLIPIGTIYVKIAGKWDGEFSTHEQHEECRDFAAKINLGYFEECVIPFGGVDGALRNPDDYGLDFDLEDPLGTLDNFRAEWSQIKVLYPEVA